MTSSDISGDLTSCQPILVRELSWDFIGLTLEQIKAQDFSDYPLLCSDLLLKRILLTYGAVVVWYDTNLLSGTVHPSLVPKSSLTFQQTFTFAPVSGALSKIK